MKLSAPQDKVVNSTIFKNNSVSTLISTSEFSVAGSNNDHALSGETCYSKDRLTGSNAGKTTQAKNTVNRVSAGMKSLAGLGRQSSRSIEQKRSACFEDSQDPYEFNNGELAPMKGKKLKKTKKLKTVSVSANNTNAGLDSEDVPQFSDGTMGLINGQEQYDDENELTKRQWAEAGTLLGDCLLSAVKVLMNLTNDNPIGCHQVAVCGGLDTMASLIVDHYPLFQCHLLSSSKRTGKDTSTESPANGSCDEVLSDQDLDLLVVILGMLFNLVEKDTGNRARLAASSVTLPCSSLSPHLHNGGWFLQVGQDREIDQQYMSILVEIKRVECQLGRLISCDGAYGQGTFRGLDWREIKSWCPIEWAILGKTFLAKSIVPQEPSDTWEGEQVLQHPSLKMLEDKQSRAGRTVMSSSF